MGQAQRKLELKLSFIIFKICCIEFNPMQQKFNLVVWLPPTTNSHLANKATTSNYLPPTAITGHPKSHLTASKHLLAIHLLSTYYTWSISSLTYNCPGGVGWSHSDNETNLSSQFNLHWTIQLELSLAMWKIWMTMRMKRTSRKRMKTLIKDIL